MTGRVVAPPQLTLREFNQLPLGEAVEALQHCCAVPSWAEAVAGQRPFSSCEHLHAVADQALGTIREEEWVAAFSRHPRIGDRETLRGRLESGAWAGVEQAGVSAASDELLDAFERDNAEYERRFGFLFLICATGRTGPEMHAAMQDRLRNSRAAELGNAAREHRAITGLRLRRLVQPEGA